MRKIICPIDSFQRGAVAEARPVQLAKIVILLVIV